MDEDLSNTDLIAANQGGSHGSVAKNKELLSKALIRDHTGMNDGHT